MTDESHAQATFGGGCFWCIEAAFEELAGVESATSGYAGGTTEDPTYEDVCTGETGHAEVVQVAYDPDRLGYEDLLKVFFTVHDPTQLNRQGPDVGTQYRSAIFYHNDAQRELAEAFVDELEAEGVYDDPIVTEIEPLDTFYEAEQYHQNYYEKNPGDAYCQFNAQPKIEKVHELFADRVADTQTT
jgi:peptide-methionine (S)-S-oxide reductase